VAGLAVTLGSPQQTNGGIMDFDRIEQLAVRIEYLMRELGGALDEAHNLPYDRREMVDWIRESVKSADMDNPDIWEDFVDGTLELLQRT
jgi:hypothetical protein